jgi:hypothetical protein
MANGRPLPPARREKIYCDKWLHEGVCAFTQMGCKYKHEMPMDKATQLSLGLNHGLPNWYRRAYGVTMTPVSPQSPPAQMISPAITSPPNPARLAGPWRRLEAPPSMDGSSQNDRHNGHCKLFEKLLVAKLISSYSKQRQLIWAHRSAIPAKSRRLHLKQSLLDAAE